MKLLDFFQSRKIGQKNQKLGLYFNPFGKVQDLINDCIAAGVDKLLDGKNIQASGFTVSLQISY